MGKKRERFTFKKPDTEWRSRLAPHQDVDLLQLCQYLPPAQGKLLTFFLMVLMINQVSADFAPVIDSYLNKEIEYTPLKTRPPHTPSEVIKLNAHSTHETQIDIYRGDSALNRFHLFSRQNEIAANVNEDLHCPFTHLNYNDMPAVEQMHKKLNRQNIGDAKIVDFWGEGRIHDTLAISGFPDAYNINHQSQKISGGIHRGKDIPNRIPTKNFNDVDVSRFIEKDTFQYVTTMAAPITKATAKEMYRIARKDDEARIIFYGDNAEYIRTLQKEAQNDFIYMQHAANYLESLDPHLLKVNVGEPNIIVPINLVLKDLARALNQSELKTAAGILIDLQVYCEQGLSRTAVITSKVDKLLSKVRGGELLDEVKALTEDTAVIEKISRKISERRSEPRA